MSSSPDQRRPTVYDIARIAGVSHATVSRALHNRPEISPATRGRILSIARQLGYRPDPMLAALNSYRRQSKAAPFQATLAYLKDTPGEIYGPWYKDLFDGVSKRAHDLGYEMDIIWTRQPGMTPRRLSNILTSRGIEGVIVSPLLSQLDPREFRLYWQHFAAVTIGYSLKSPMIHRICDDYTFTINEVFRQIYSRGYRRPCLFIPRFLNERNNHRWLSAYLLHRENQPRGFKATYFIPETPHGKLFQDVFSSWWSTLDEKPDVFLFVDEPNADGFLKGMKWALPEDMGVVILNKLSELSAYSGILVRNSKFGEVAVSLLVSLLHSNEKGLPEQPQTISVQGIWAEGSTLRKNRLKPE